MMKYFRSMLVAVCACLMPTSTMAQLTLDECQRLAMENYPLLKKYDMIERSADFSIKSINTGYLPQLRMSGQATWQTDVTAFPDAFNAMPGNNVSIEGLDKRQYRIAIDLEQTIWDGGNIKARKRAARAEEYAQSKQTDVDMYEIRERVNNLYFGILLLEDKLRQNEDVQGLLLANLRKMDNLYQNGVAMKSDVDAISAEHLQVRQQHTELTSQKESFIQMLSLFISKPASEIAGLQKPVVTIPTENDVLHPQLKLFDAQMGKIDSQRKMLDSGVLPSFSFFAQGYWGYPGYDMFNDMLDRSPSLNGMVGIRMNWNIGKLYSRRNDIRRLDMAKQQVANSKEVFLFNNQLKSMEERRMVERYQKVMKDDHEIIALRAAIRQSAEAKLELGVVDVNNLLREINRESEAKTNLAIHEIEMLKHVYELKHIVNQ